MNHDWMSNDYQSDDWLHRLKIWSQGHRTLQWGRTPRRRWIPGMILSVRPDDATPMIWLGKGSTHIAYHVLYWMTVCVCVDYKGFWWCGFDVAFSFMRLPAFIRLCYSECNQSLKVDVTSNTVVIHELLFELLFTRTVIRTVRANCYSNCYSEKNTYHLENIFIEKSLP